MTGHLQQRGERVWRLYVDGPRDPVTGRRKQRTRIFRGSEQRALVALRAFVREVTDDQHIDHGRDTVAELIAAWLAVKTPNLTPNTLRGYRSKIDTIIVPLIGDVRLCDLDVHRLNGLYARLLAGTRDRQKLSPNSVRRVHAILHAALHQAVTWEWIDKNPASHTERISVPQAEERNLDPALVAKVIRDAPAETLGDIAHLAAVTGLRVGELCALRWSDLDPYGRTLAVRRRIMADGTVRARTKNNRTRAVGLDRRTTARLRLRHQRARLRMRACGAELDDANAYVFSEVTDGLRPVSPGVISQRWVKHRQRLNVDLTFHGLRHAHASWLLDDGAQMARVSNRLGHARQSTTADVYSHVMRASDHDLADTIAKKLR